MGRSSDAFAPHPAFRIAVQRPVRALRTAAVDRRHSAPTATSTRRIVVRPGRLTPSADTAVPGSCNRAGDAMPAPVKAAAASHERIAGEAKVFPLSDRLVYRDADSDLYRAQVRCRGATRTTAFTSFSRLARFRPQGIAMRHGARACAVSADRTDRSGRSRLLPAVHDRSDARHGPSVRLNRIAARLSGVASDERFTPGQYRERIGAGAGTFRSEPRQLRRQAVRRPIETMLKRRRAARRPEGRADE